MRWSVSRGRCAAGAAVAVLALCLSSACRADDTQKQFWPEFDLIKRLDPKTRLIFKASVTGDRETRDYGDGALGLELDYRTTPRLGLRTGYHYLHSDPSGLGAGQTENRLLFDVHPNWKLGEGFYLFDRNRVEIRDI